MNKNPLISIVILSYNRRGDLEETLQQLQRVDYQPLEIIVVDNNSADGTVRMIRENFPAVRVVALDKNSGVAGYNHGFSQAAGDYVVVLDDDSFVHPDALKKMVAVFEENPRIGIVAFEVRNYFQKEELNKYLLNNSETIGSSQGYSYQLAFNGAGAGIRRELLLKAGGYAEEFFLYWNEQDLALKVLNFGFKIVHCPDILAFHKLSAVNRSSWRAPFFYTRNLLWLLWKHYPFLYLLKETLLVFYLIFYSTFEQMTLVYLKALAQALFKFPGILKKRHPVKKEIVSDLRLTYRIAFNYFK